MRRIAKTVVALLALAVICTAATVAGADEKMVGVVYRIELADDGKSADVTLLDNKTDEEVHVIVTDELTLDKFKDHRIVGDDEVRVKYEEKDGKKHATYFRKTAGC